MKVYLDYAAATPVAAGVRERMDLFFSERFGNPGSLHSAGREVRAAICAARESIARLLECSSSELIFTSSGTESCNLAVLGVARANKGKGMHIITQKTEHHAVLNACKQLEQEGFSVTYLDVDKYGLVSIESVSAALREDTILVSIMYVNNEIGMIQPIQDVARLCRQRGVLFHTDACQAGLLDFSIKNLCVDLLSFSAAKVYGPKGCAFLYVREGVNLAPLLFGGGQESGLRPGTENVSAIVGFSSALELFVKEREVVVGRLNALRRRFIYGLKDLGVLVNGHDFFVVPNILSITIQGVESGAVLQLLDERGVCASSGAACTEQKIEPSHVITALGRPNDALSSVRFSFGKETTEKDVDYAVAMLKEVLLVLRDAKGELVAEAV